VLIIDAANVIGSVPNGWWRDRAGAVQRLRDRLVPVATHGVSGLAGPLRVVLVVEGAARNVDPVPGVEVVSAPGTGDDTIVELVRQAGSPCTVVTADRGLRDRVTALGASIMGPRCLPYP
jgi:hypothetical protein